MRESIHNIELKVLIEIMKNIAMKIVNALVTLVGILAIAERITCLILLKLIKMQLISLLQMNKIHIY